MQSFTGPRSKSLFVHTFSVGRWGSVEANGNMLLTLPAGFKASVPIVLPPPSGGEHISLPVISSLYALLEAAPFAETGVIMGGSDAWASSSSPSQYDFELILNTPEVIAIEFEGELAEQHPSYPHKTKAALRNYVVVNHYQEFFNLIEGPSAPPVDRGFLSPSLRDVVSLTSLVNKVL